MHIPPSAGRSQPVSRYEQRGTQRRRKAQGQQRAESSGVAVAVAAAAAAGGWRAFSDMDRLWERRIQHACAYTCSPEPKDNTARWTKLCPPELLHARPRSIRIGSADHTHHSSQPPGALHTQACTQRSHHNNASRVRVVCCTSAPSSGAAQWGHGCGCPRTPCHVTARPPLRDQAARNPLARAKHTSSRIAQPRPSSLLLVPEHEEKKHKRLFLARATK